MPSISYVLCRLYDVYINNYVLHYQQLFLLLLQYFTGDFSTLFMCLFGSCKFIHVYICISPRHQSKICPCVMKAAQTYDMFTSCMVYEPDIDTCVFLVYRRFWSLSFSYLFHLSESHLRVCFCDPIPFSSCRLDAETIS